MSALKTIAVIAGVGAGGLALAHFASAALHPGSTSTTDPGAQLATQDLGATTATTTITKRQRLQQLQADLSKHQTLLDDANTKLANAKAQAGSTCNWIYSQRQWCGLFCDLASQGRAYDQCRSYVRNQSSDVSLLSQSSYYQSTAKTSVQELRAKVQSLQADAKRYQAQVKAIQAQIDNLNAQGVY